MKMNRTRAALITGAAVIGVGLGSFGIAAATGAVGSDDDGSEVPITGEALDQASAAALEFTGEGTVTETEAGDEDSFYEVEVTLDDGSQVDVQLDESFTVLYSEGDDDSGGDDN